MPASDYIFDQRGLNLRNPAPPAAKSPQTHFRVQLSDGTKHDVLADNPADAAKHVEKRNSGLKATRTKVIREKVPA